MRLARKYGSNTAFNLTVCTLKTTQLSYRPFLTHLKHPFIKTSRVCVSVCLCITKVKYLGGRTRLVRHNFWTYHTLSCVWVITSRHNQGTAAEVDAIGEQCLKLLVEYVSIIISVYAWGVLLWHVGHLLELPIHSWIFLPPITWTPRNQMCLQLSSYKGQGHG